MSRWLSQTPQHSTRVQALRPPSLGAAGVPPHRLARASGERVAEGRLSDGEGTGGNALTGASPNARLPIPLAPPPSRVFSQTQHPRFQPPWTQGLPQAHGQDPAPTRQTGQWASEPFFFFFLRQEIIWFYLEAAGHMMERQVWHKITEV